MLKHAAAAIEEFRYPNSGVAAPSSWEHLVSTIDAASPIATSPDNSSAGSLDDPHSDELARAFERGRKEGIKDGRRIERLEEDARLEQVEGLRIEQVAKMNEEFAIERDGFLRMIEPELVKLALRVAERIVRRELQVDPLILTGTVRTALGQLAEKTTIRMRVPAADADMWTETLAHLPNLRVKPEVVADAQLRQGECELESSCGRADLGVASQLREIARSFLGDGAPTSALDAPSEQVAAEGVL
jgi:flagellar assembly protein FliH